MNNIIQSPVPLTLKVFKFGQELSVQDVRFYNLAYETWKNTWRDVYNEEMQLNTQLYSNDFTRQAHVVALFQGYQCVGLAFMRDVNFDFQTTKEDSYFRFWPKQTLDEIGKTEPQIVVASFFTIAPDYRRSKTIEWKTLFLSLYLDYFSTLLSPIMITAARKLKSNEKLCYDLGAISIQNNLHYMSEQSHATVETVDLLYWKRNVTFSLKDSNLQTLRETIWTRYLQEASYEKRNVA